MMKSFFVCLFACLFFIPAFAQQPARFSYAIKGNDTLWMDHYAPSATPNRVSVLFIHGGAFTNGSPDQQKPMAEGLANMGYNVFVISYRLYMKGRGFGCEIPTQEKLKAIRLAVEDAADATKYLLNNATKLNVDPRKLILSGSSAGAETALQLMYNPFETGNPAEYEFMNKFQFAGAMIFAGAVVDINLVTKKTWIPTLFMHGTEDPLVPYATAAHHYCQADKPGWLILFGPKTLYDWAVAHDAPCVFYSYEGEKHNVSGYMFKEFDKMDAFMKAAVNGTFEGQQLVDIPKQQ
ncbi:hypothetical protein COR50_00975 [Chitinophaga caeni]|uniref:BD-FAE-like domain-containing protein n=1 Tax=Chitinophaga caeni TaxID=2029983 RepID=A0A291QPS3_9BACT|nr:alpha/beta hydrolase [Chitinophaga caeni]ATL45844.1 hypothetical protein COR50_00975 [Chitinophaga caeni]